MENQRVATSEHLRTLQSRMLSSSAVVLDRRIEKLRVAIKDRQAVGNIIEWQNLGNEEGFAHVLESLARNSNTQFTLEKIRLSAGGKTLEMAGATRKAEEIPIVFAGASSRKENAEHAIWPTKYRRRKGY